ncbi:hypothetical protein BGZ51_001959 [Haplosporangium sp. Z 767]|nr:hypothetical protein BGZ50_005656 [Haplosporangium sp. Z 11]KAF9186554.1 hypothetical protein BGZ51_001959 [Haplosporangium sp. Z 767]
MKFTLSVAALALAATQVMAVVPTPAANCTVSIMVTDSDVDGCVAFATRHNTTFEMLLKMNDKLRKDCLNLDVGHPICVSWDVKATQPATPSATTAPVTTKPATTGPAPGATTTAATGASTTSAPGTTTAKATTGSVTAPSATPQPTNGAAGSTASMMLAAAGVVLSVAYMM